KTRPGACEVDPPGVSSGPCSSTSVFVAPRWASSSARFAPTMPAPMMTMRGAVLMGALSRGSGVDDEIGQCGGAAGQELPGGDLACADAALVVHVDVALQLHDLAG